MKKILAGGFRASAFARGRTMSAPIPTSHTTETTSALKRWSSLDTPGESHTRVAQLLDYDTINPFSRGRKEDTLAELTTITKIVSTISEMMAQKQGQFKTDVALKWSDLLRQKASDTLCKLRIFFTTAARREILASVNLRNQSSLATSPATDHFSALPTDRPKLEATDRRLLSKTIQGRPAAKTTTALTELVSTVMDLIDLSSITELTLAEEVRSALEPLVVQFQETITHPSILECIQEVQDRRNKTDDSPSIREIKKIIEGHQQNHGISASL